MLGATRPQALRLVSGAVLAAAAVEVLWFDLVLAGPFLVAGLLLLLSFGVSRWPRAIAGTAVLLGFVVPIVAFLGALQGAPGLRARGGTPQWGLTPELFDRIIRSLPASSQRSARPGAALGEDPSTRDRMLDVALQTFAELGYDGASTRTIATRAGVNQGLIPYYFGSKEKLWREAVDRAFEQLVADAPGLLERGDLGAAAAREQTADLIRRFVRFSARRPEFTRMMCEEGKREGPRMDWIVDRHVRPFFEAVAARIEGQREGGAADSLDAVLFFYILVGAVTHLFHQAPECRRLTGRDPADEAMVEAHADALIALFVGPPQGDPS